MTAHPQSRRRVSRAWPRRIGALALAVAAAGLTGPPIAVAQVRPDPPASPTAMTANVIRPLPLPGTKGSGSDLVASAQPTAVDPQAADNETATLTLNRPGKANTVATASATCDGCAGTATATAQVRFLPAAGSIRADNVATAWNANCENCSAQAVSIQVVTARFAADVTVTNRALAINVACTRCDSTAVAIQYVLVGVDPIPPRPNTTTPDAETGQLATRIAQTMRSAPPSLQRAAILADAQRGRADLQQRYGASSATVTVDYQTG